MDDFLQPIQADFSFVVILLSTKQKLMSLENISNPHFNETGQSHQCQESIVVHAIPHNSHFSITLINFLKPINLLL